jgi:hypothetical protein
MPIVGTVYPGIQEWAGVGRELTPGTAVASAAVVEVDKIEPDEKVTGLIDKSLRGQMAEEYAYIQGTESADVSLNGPVYMDTIGYFLHNILGDYSATGSTPANATTFTAPLAVGATTGTLTSSTGYTASSIVQIGSGATAEVVQFTALAGANATWANNPCRFAHSGTPAAATVVAPYTHTFALMNSGNGQPATHTLTHYQGISGTYKGNQYPFFCASEVDFTFDVSGLFSHETKGTSYIKQPLSAAPANNFSTILALPAWRLLVGIAGPASGGTLISDVATVKINLKRAVKPYWTANGQQNPYVIGRAGFMADGGFNEVAQNEVPMLNYLNNVQPQLQMVITNGGSGAGLLSATFNFATGAYDTAKLNSGDEIEYDVTWKGIANTTNAGGSGGLSPCSVVLVNAVPTY